MKTAIFGGTFNPPHAGHKRLALAARSYADKVLVIPAFIPPHKKESIVSPEHRLNMTRLAFENTDKIEVSDIEIKAATVSYTIDTLEKLKDTHGELFLLIGDDLIFSFPDWHRYEDILKLAKLLVWRRTRKKIHSTPLSQGYGIPVAAVFPNFEPIEISSEQIRKNIQSGTNPEQYLDSKVYDYIKENGLYEHSHRTPLF
ncbi:MAG: nicotinate (nicotinamide) nucleotide adenylyltransferase [Oscillospiraceae bacterium]|nr:nicotinate (nicotinamide) nucleotide adenylyltransferase [Oscillospiraceae bacterium]